MDQAVLWLLVFALSVVVIGVVALRNPNLKRFFIRGVGEATTHHPTEASVSGVDVKSSKRVEVSALGQNTSVKDVRTEGSDDVKITASRNAPDDN